MSVDKIHRMDEFYARLQAKRKANLQVLHDESHRSKYHDYDDSFTEFACEYGLEHDDVEYEEGDEFKDIPRFASIAHDETYTMLHMCETLAEAMQDQAGIPGNGEYLNVPGGIIDLDEMEIRTDDNGTVRIVHEARSFPRMIAISEDAYSILCGLVQDTKTLDERELDVESIMGKDAAWDELRTIFPFDDYVGHDNL